MPINYDEIERLYEAATKGPWTADYTEVPYAEIGEGWVVDSTEGSVCTLDCPKDDMEVIARLIVAMHSALPTLLAEARRAAAMREALAGLEKAATEVSRHGAQTGSQWTRLTTALILARAALSEQPS